MSIKPIPTNAFGYRFRSRNEARWAVLLEHLGIKWQYEPEGVQLPSGYYLPDFRLLGTGWLAVKGQEPDTIELKKLRELADASEQVVLLARHIPGESESYLRVFTPTQGASISPNIETLIRAADAARGARFEHGETPERRVWAPRKKAEGKPKVYLAGKITKNGWRERLVSPGVYEGEDLRTWPVRDAGRFSFVGPYFIKCDHGCAHGPNTHGMKETDCTSSIWYDAFSHDENSVRDQPGWVVNRCLSAVDKADYVFAWIEPEAHGTLVEIGYAMGRGIPVFAGVPAPDGLIALTEYDADGHGSPARNPAWFPLRACTAMFEGSLESCFERFLKAIEA